jgi:hypothetical protein
MKIEETHLVAPVVHAFLVIDLLAETIDDLARRPSLAIWPILLRHQRIQDGYHPIFKRAVIRVWY